jgi:hypothetical protein
VAHGLFWLVDAAQLVWFEPAREAGNDPGLGSSVGAVSFPEYLASWLNRYPSDRGWVDDDANFACRRSEAAWLRGLRLKPGLTQDDMEQLVRWKFRWRAAQMRPLDAVRGDRCRATAEVAKNAIADARDHLDDDAGAMNAIRWSVKGFGVPMASVFLALYFPDRFTIADSRALETLRARRGYPAGARGFTTDGWVRYLAECRAILTECRASGVVPRFEGEWTLRGVDQALWAANGAPGPAGSIV